MASQKVTASSLAARFALWLLATAVSFPAAAQTPERGRLTGTVSDQSGAPIPGAAVLARSAHTGLKAETDEAGTWTIPSVPNGSYTVSVTAQGFRTSSFNDVSVEAGATVTVNATLQIGLADTVAVTASKFEEETINAPAAATIISGQTIRDTGLQNVADLLRTVPGMNVAQTSARGFDVTGRAANGVLPSAQLALIDGRTIYLDYLGYVGWDGLPTNINEIEQVEVIRGPASAVWGANAMNGVINIITKSPRAMLGTALTLGIGEFDRSGASADGNTGFLYFVNATHAQGLSPRWSWKITGGFCSQDALARPQGNIPNPYHTPYPPFKNEGTTQPQVDARVDYDASDGEQHFSLREVTAEAEASYTRTSDLSRSIPAT